MKTFVEADAEYRRAVESPGTALSAALTAATQVSQLNLNADDVTIASILRLRSFFRAQAEIKLQLDKVYAAPAADFFVETVLFYLRVAFARLDPSLIIASERNIVSRRGSLRPDISIWRGGDVVAAVECKTQLGWNRDGWLQDFESRETRLRDVHPDSKLFLLVMTGSNWSGFGNDLRVGNQLFVLLNNIWPHEFDESVRTSIVHRIENLISAILQHADCRIVSSDIHTAPP